jgi:hypothetical protein
MPSAAETVQGIFDFLDNLLGKPEDDRPASPKLKAIEPPKIEAPLPEPESPKLKYYPSNKHILKGQAPETKLTEDDLRSITLAQKHAVKTGVLSPDLAAKLLPMAMVEGWSGNYGIAASLGLHPSKANIKTMEKMGLTIEDRQVQWEPYTPEKDLQIKVIMGEKGKSVPAITLGAIKGSEAMARLMAAILSVKSKGKDVDSPEAAVERYNGKGKAIEVVAGHHVPADSKRYVEKVQEALSLLQHPKNKELHDKYMSFLDSK